jgi:hypothetical protein
MRGMAEREEAREIRRAPKGARSCGLEQADV